MQITELLLYFAIGAVFFLLFMFRKEKPKHPTPLDMKDFSPKRDYKDPQLMGAKAVSVQIEDETIGEDEGAAWASPTVVSDGKVKDAYAILGLDAGAPLNQVRERVSLLLKEPLSPSQVDIIKRAYRAIVDANNS